MKKFELTTDFKMYCGKKLFRIRALIDFGDVKAGDLGGYIEKEKNLSHNGNAWVYGNARVSGYARVSGDARVYDNARVSGNADILQITGLGTEHRPTTVFRAEDGIKVACGCFLGDLGQFLERVKNTRTGKVQKEYLKFAELVEIYFGKEEERNVN